MPKIIPNVPDDNGQIKEIDILKYEIDGNKPYWLAPAEKFFAKHEDQRRASYAKYSAEQKAKREKQK